MPNSLKRVFAPWKNCIETLINAYLFPRLDDKYSMSPQKEIDTEPTQKYLHFIKYNKDVLIGLVL